MEANVVEAVGLTLTYAKHRSNRLNTLAGAAAAGIVVVML